MRVQLDDKLARVETAYGGIIEQPQKILRSASEAVMAIKST